MLLANVLRHITAVRNRAAATFKKINACTVTAALLSCAGTGNGCKTLLPRELGVFWVPEWFTMVADEVSHTLLNVSFHVTALCATLPTTVDVTHSFLRPTGQRTEPIIQRGVFVFGAKIVIHPMSTLKALGAIIVPTKFSVGEATI
jgi:hypothetical protein